MTLSSHRSLLRKAKRNPSVTTNKAETPLDRRMYRFRRVCRAPGWSSPTVAVLWHDRQASAHSSNGSTLEVFSWCRPWARHHRDRSRYFSVPLAPTPKPGERRFRGSRRSFHSLLSDGKSGYQRRNTSSHSFVEQARIRRAQFTSKSLSDESQST